MVEMHYWEQLAAIAEASTLTEAAEALHLTQPALSRSMRRLEAQLGVELFDRSHARASLNGNGRLAAHLAERLLEQEAELVERVRALDRSRRTITLVSCASFPVREIVPVLGDLYPGMVVTTEVTDDEGVAARLEGPGNVLAVTRRPVDAPGVACRPYLDERLYLSVGEDDPLAGLDAVSFSDFDGATMLLYAHTGVWQEVVERELPNTRFLLQDDMATFRELVASTALPSFTSSWHLDRNGVTPGRVAVPIVDEGATLTYHLCCLESALPTLGKVLDLLSRG